MAFIGGISGTRYKNIISKNERYSKELIQQWVRRNKDFIETFDLLFEANSYDEIGRGNLIIIEDGIVRLEPITEEFKNKIIERIEIEKTIKVGRPKEKVRMHTTRELVDFLRDKGYTTTDFMKNLGLEEKTVWKLRNKNRVVDRYKYIWLLRRAYRLGFEVNENELYYVL